MNKQRMKSTLIGIAAFLHDIGKVLQKADTYGAGELSSMQYSPEILGNKKGYLHTLFTHEFFENIIVSHKNYTNLEKLWRDCSEESIDISMTASMHHNPSNSNKASVYIRDADWLASGLDRDTDDENKHDKIKNYKQMKLSSLLSLVDIENTKKNSDCFYKQSALTINNMFPNSEPTSLDKSVSSYSDVVKLLECDFVKLMDIFKESNEECLYRFADGLDGLMLKYTSLLPAATTDGDLGVSLYEHSKLTAAFASTLANCSEEKYKKFILLRGEFFGIQNFILNKEASNKNSSKILRGKSFFISLITEIAILIFLDELDIPIFNILQNGAGKFLIIAADTDEYQEKIKSVQNKIDQWLYDKYYAQVSLGIKKVFAQATDFQTNTDTKGFDRLLQELNNSDNEKFTRFKLNKSKSVFDDYHNKFSNSKELCSCCLVDVVSKDGNCEKCNEYEALGANLIKSNSITFFKSRSGIFNSIGYSFDGTSVQNYLSSISIDIGNHEVGRRITHYKSYVYRKSDGEIATFNELASLSEGVSMLGVLKADVDNLGAIFAYGLSEDISEGTKISFHSNNTFSRYNTMSRSIHLFFSYYLPELIKNGGRKIYTVFSGGDDLFLIGSYDDIVELALDIDSEFNRYVGGNNSITLSAGIAFFKASTPIWFMEKNAEEMLEKSKNNKDKNSITILNSTSKWEIFREKREEFDSMFNNFFDVDGISTATFYKLMQFADMSITFEETQEYELLMWRPYLHYMLSRLTNVNKEIKDEFTFYIEKFLSDNPGLLKTLIQLKLYKKREKGEANE